MRAQIAMFLVAAGTIAGCASNPPPPAPMAMDPAPMAPMTPAPVMAGAVDGMYRGTAEAAGTLGRGCAKPGTVSTRVRNNTFVLKGIRARVNADGTVSNISRRGGTVTGTINGGTMDVTTTAGRCSYHVTATHA